MPLFFGHQGVRDVDTGLLYVSQVFVHVFMCLRCVFQHSSTQDSGFFGRPFSTIIKKPPKGTQRKSTEKRKAERRGGRPFLSRWRHSSPQGA